MSKHLRRLVKHPVLWLGAAGLLIFLLSWNSFNKHGSSDPRLTLLVSQSILDHGAVHLDAYQNDLIIGAPFQDYLIQYTIIPANGHYYYYFPAGPSVLALPAVALARLAGWDMRTTQNYTLQYLLAALSTVAVFFILYRMARYYLSRPAAYTLALIAVLGSSLISTLGTALWSLNFSTLILALALLVLVRGEQSARFHPYLFGLLLFLAFFVRPSTVAFIIPALLYLLLRDRPLLLRSAAVAATLLLLFLLWSRREYGSFLPAYYTPSRLTAERVPLWIGVLGNLVSPSRGLFIFSPFLLAVFAGLLRFWQDLSRRPLPWLCLGWFALQLFLVARAASWWGGWSFGPRLLTDALPGLILVAVYVWEAAGRRFQPAGQRLALALFLALGLLSALIHTGQGLYSQAAERWNRLVRPVPPAGAEGLGDLFDWRYGQIWATEERNCALERRQWRRYLPHDHTLAPYRPGTPITYVADTSLEPPLLSYSVTAPAATNPSQPDTGRLPPQLYLPRLHGPGNRALFIGWGPPETGFRWSQCRQAQLLFRPDNSFAAHEQLQLQITAASLGPQEVRLLLNETPIGTLHWAGSPQTAGLSFPAGLLWPGEINELTFEFPQATSPRPRLQNWRLQADQRLLALALEEVRISELRQPAE